MRLVIATKNKHKLQEIKAILGELPGYEIVSLENYPDVPEVVEDQETFVGNAHKKALETAAFLNEVVVADDSGLSVDALNGEPGVYSARYAGPGATYKELCQKLLTNLKNVGQRSAHFTTVIAVAKPNQILQTLEGICEGEIIQEMRGTNGFGYDPVFYYQPLNKTFAEMSEQEKNQISHRARALVKLKQYLLNSPLI